jgi:hypothetical protein
VSDPNDLQKVHLQLAILNEDMRDIKSVLRDLSTALTKLALVEERQLNTSHTVERAFKEIQGLNARLSQLEIANPELRRTSGWVDKLVIAAVAALLTFLLTKGLT